MDPSGSRFETLIRINFSDSRLRELAAIHPEKEQEIEGMLVEHALLL